MIACELCGAGGPHRPLYPEKEIVRCGACGLVFYDRAADTSALYDADYFDGGEYWNYAGEKAALQLDFARRVQELRGLAPRAKTLLELGCARGYFLELARRHWRVQGVELSAAAAREARERLGADVQCGDFLALPETPEAYDIVCLWDTIEHLPHPVRTLEKAARSLKPGGVVAVSTGDVGSALARWRGASWRQIHPPTHLFYFTPETLTAAFAKAGLKTETVRRPGQRRSYRGMVNKLFRGGPARGLVELLTLGGRIDFPVYLNTRDLIAAYARKAPAAAGREPERGAP